MACSMEFKLQRDEGTLYRRLAGIVTFEWLECNDSG